MKIVQLVAADSVGGLGKHVIELSNALCETASVTTIADSSYKGQLDSRVEYIEFDVARAKGNVLAFFRLYQLLKKIEPSIVHSHGNKASLVLARMQAFIAAKTIGTIHWELKKNKDRKIFSRLNAVIGVTDGVLDNVNNPRQFVVNNGVPLTPPSLNTEELRARFKLSADKPVAIAVGRIVKVKGFDILLQAWQGINAYLILVGDGPELGELQALAEWLGLNGNVRFAGHVDNAQDIFPACDLIVLSSLHEGFGYVIAEALIHKKPIVSTEVTFAKQILPQEYLAEPGDISSLHAKLALAFDDLPALNSSLRDAYEWGGNNLTIEKMAENTVACYRQLVEAV